MFEPYFHAGLLGPLLAAATTAAIGGCALDVPRDESVSTSDALTSTALRAHVARMATEGWAAKNRDTRMKMFACDDASTPRECFTRKKGSGREPLFPASPWAVAGTTIRMLADTTELRSPWARVSPDGRFVGASGVGIVDLAGELPSATPRMVPVASLDPAFAPDGKSFVVVKTGAKAPGSGPFLRCPQSMLTAPPPLAWSACIPLDVGDYESIGAATDGADQFVVGIAGVQALIADNGGFVVGPRQALDLGIAVIASPSFELTSSLVVNDDDGATRVVVDALARKKTEAGYTFSTRRLASFPLPARGIGTYGRLYHKATFSYDERFLAMPVRTGDESYDIFMTDLATGRTVQITKVGPTERAYSPTFRSDGWCYFVVVSNGARRIVASDAALASALWK